jgi:hypothetical protein
MTRGPQVPLDAAREPGVPESEIAEPYPVVVVEKLSTADLVLQGPEPTAKFEKDSRTEVAVLQDRHAGRLRHELA